MMMMMIIDGDVDVDVNLIVKPSPTILTSIVSSCPSRTGIKPFEKKLYLFFFCLNAKGTFWQLTINEFWPNIDLDFQLRQQIPSRYQ